MSDDNYYKVGGSLEYQHPTYVVRQADSDLYEGLINGEFCYVLNSRQMGKSSLRVHMMKKLKEQGVKCASIDMTRIGSHVNPDEWYGGIVSELLRGFTLSKKISFSSWWREHQLLPPLQRLRELIEDVLLTEFSHNLVIFFDEIDSILKIKFKDDFFAFIRACYNQRGDNPEYKRLTFCLLGVATPSDLIQDKQRTPFNIGRAIGLTGFKLEEAKFGLTRGLTQKVDNPEKVVAEVLYWTDGQPFLTQKLCQLIVEKADSKKPNIEELVQKHVIDNWEAQDEPEHLKTIRDRLIQDEKHTVSLLGLYQQILQHGEIVADDSSDQTELRLSGVVLKKQGKLRVYNCIYESVFNLNWVEQELEKLRPYAKELTVWLASNCQDESHLLSGQALKDAQVWTEGKSLSIHDYQFLAASQKKTNEILNQIVWELVSPLSVDKVSPKLANLIQRLQQVSGDNSLILLKIEVGSTIIVLKGSQEGFERIIALWNIGQLTEVLGIPIQDVKYATPEHHETVSMAREPNILEGSQQVIAEIIPKESLEEQLSLLVAEACEYTTSSAERQKNLTRIIRLVTNKLWRENKPYYQDALQQTWVYFCQNICEGNTGKPYNPTRSSVVTWLNSYLKRRLQDFYIENQKQLASTVPHQIERVGSGETNQATDPIEALAAKPDVPCLIEEVRRWVQSDPEGELSSIHITNHPEVTAKVLILRRLPPETSWKMLSAEFNLSISTLSSFYQRQCLPCLRKFGELERDL